MISRNHEDFWLTLHEVMLRFEFPKEGIPDDETSSRCH